MLLLANLSLLWWSEWNVGGVLVDDVSKLHLWMGPSGWWSFGCLLVLCFWGQRESVDGKLFCCCRELVFALMVWAEYSAFLKAMFSSFTRERADWVGGALLARRFLSFWIEKMWGNCFAIVVGIDQARFDSITESNWQSRLIVAGYVWSNYNE